MTDAKTEYPYPQKGARAAPDKREMRIFLQSAMHEGGSREMPAPAARFARRFSATVSHYPEQRELPNWFRALIEKKVSAEELAQTVRDRLHRAPTEENQELALIVANEIARMKGGPEALAKHVQPEFLARLAGDGGQQP